jgi:hypothetical protein
MPPTPPPGPGGGLGGPSSPFASLLSDVSADLGPGWSAVDIAVRALKIALRSVEFQKMPKVVAQLQSQMNTLNTLVTSYTMGVQSGPATPTIERNSAQDTGAADADSAPAATDGADAD